MFVTEVPGHTCSLYLCVGVRERWGGLYVCDRGAWATGHRATATWLHQECTHPRHTPHRHQENVSANHVYNFTWEIMLFRLYECFIRCTSSYLMRSFRVVKLRKVLKILWGTTCTVKTPLMNQWMVHGFRNKCSLTNISYLSSLLTPSWAYW